MKFAASYSGGKESVLAIHHAIQQGHTPIVLITTFNTDHGRSHFHGLSEELLEAASTALDIPLLLVKTTSAGYANDFENALHKAKAMGAEACVFGDIDIEGHRSWCTQRCESAGITPMFPLWGRERGKVVNEFIDQGFTANITIVNNQHLNDDFLGQELTKDLLAKIERTGADICGENGEYHTFVSAGPIFKYPVVFTLGEKVISGEYAMLRVQKHKYRACYNQCGEDGGIECDFSILADEAACLTGLLHALVSQEELREELHFVCEVIYNLSPAFRGSKTLTADALMRLEAITARHKQKSEALLVLPLGSRVAALSHLLRVKCKGLVRLLCKHKREENKGDELLFDFANQLSGYFYNLACKLNIEIGKN